MKKAYTGKERIIATCKGENTDRVPIDLHLPMAHELAGYSFEECVLEPEKELEARVKAQELFPSDMVNAPGNPLLPRNASVLARLLSIPEPGSTYKINEKSDIANLEIPDPTQDKLYKKHLELCSKSVEVFKDYWVNGLFGGPWTAAAYALRGMEKLIYDTIDDPSFVHDLMHLACEHVKVYGNLLYETGVNLRIGDPCSSCSVISPKIYKEFIHPYLKNVIDYFKEKDANVILHICGFTDPILEDIASLDADIIEIDGPTQLATAIEVSNKRKTIKGNIAAELLLNGTESEIDDAVKNCINIGGKKGKYILSHGCTIPDESSMENIKAYWDAGLKYGNNL
jgi:uroporphyrinogen decarboxylase